ncbi:hypothetical protein GPECTOR_8g70 [Gonium pectorale]|uniref:Uncharacterized protein n=1 Tax=Gonium pectorale TaxID=33097 RepID=A0A150GTS2_GONPE|nr:hypothetical protein GPECTOR_8g70 [Gonium pectorale]|eukprot:KXZ53078.1 hypothetical protein GPECTOR_8g70 [Gonium pectorale]
MEAGRRHDGGGGDGGGDMRGKPSSIAGAPATNGGSRLPWPLLTNLALASILALWLFANRPDCLQSPEAILNAVAEAVKGRLRSGRGARSGGGTSGPAAPPPPPSPVVPPPRPPLSPPPCLVGVNPALAQALRRAVPQVDYAAAAPEVVTTGIKAARSNGFTAVPGAHASSAPVEATAASSVPAKKQCLRCCSAPATVGVLHGRSVHLCLCADCVPGFAVGDPCPRCGVPATSVLRCILA